MQEVHYATFSEVQVAITIPAIHPALQTTTIATAAAVVQIQVPPAAVEEVHPSVSFKNSTFPSLGGRVKLNFYYPSIMTHEKV